MGADNSARIRLRVLTPLRVVFDRLVDFVIARGAEGDIGILRGHEQCTALLGFGMLRVFIEKKEIETFSVLGGILTVENNEVVVLSDMAERPDDLQAAIDKLKREREANHINEQAAELNMHRAEMALRRALVHMDVSAYSVIKENEE